MISGQVVTISLAAVLAAFCYQQGYIALLLHWSLNIMAVLSGGVLGVAMVICRGKRYIPPAPNKETSKVHELLKQMMYSRGSQMETRKKVIISRNLDVSIDGLLKLVIRDYVMDWYSELSRDNTTFPYMLRQDMWKVIENLSTRLSRIDTLKLMTQDFADALRKHFHDVKEVSVRDQDSPNSEFILHPWLASEDAETEFLRKVADVLLIYLLPDEYASCLPARHLLREIVACKVLKPSVESICDPDNINQTLLSNIEYRETHKKTYTYAASYEQFMKMIQECEDVEMLKQMRYSIMTEIMHATVINNLKKAQGLDIEKDTAPKGTGKGDLLKARNLKRYINQLRTSKNKVEKRIRHCGGEGYDGYGSDEEDSQVHGGGKVFSFHVVMHNPQAQEYFMKFLRRDDNHSLLEFWNAVEKLKHAEKKYQHQIGTDIYHMSISRPSSLVTKLLDRGTIKRIEGFLLGNMGPEAFFTAQVQVWNELDSNYYPSYIVSDVYHKYVSKLEEEETEVDVSSHEALPDHLMYSIPGSPEEQKEPSFGSHELTQALHKRLQILDDKTMNKAQALQAMKHTQKSDDTKRAKVVDELQQELDELKSQRRQLEFHIEKTELWWENVGRWKAHIYNAELSRDEDTDKMVPNFAIVVDLQGFHTRGRSMQDSTSGWVVSRTLDEFHTLHNKLIMIAAWLTKKQLPTLSKLPFKSVNKAFLEKAKGTLSTYLTTVLKDDMLSQSEALYAFLSPSPDYLKHHPPRIKSAKFSIPNIFRGLSSSKGESSSEDELLLMDDEGVKDDRSKDSIAQPLYLLIGEIFELSGVFKWLRKSLMVFVQATSGRTINRQLRETVDWIFSEPMIIYYIQLFCNSFWPGGHLAPPTPPRSDEEKMRTRMAAKNKFLDSIPDAMKNLFGEKNSRKGAIKIFEVFQDGRLNKHLFYVLLELVLLEVLPEVKSKMEELTAERQVPFAVSSLNAPPPSRSQSPETVQFDDQDADSTDQATRGQKQPLPQVEVMFHL